jgi:uncharacterized membrane protein
MKPALIIFAAWLLFGGSHLLLSGSLMRAALVNKFGQRGFTIVFTGVTVITIAALMAAVSVFGHQGRPGLGLKAYPAARWGIGTFGALGAVLAVAGLLNYPRSPMAILAQRQRERARYVDLSLAPPSAIERAVRHPFFTGLAFMMTAHVLLASTLASAVYFAGFVILAVAGIPLQDRKLRARWKQIYTEFEANTSNIPLAAGSVFDGRKSDSNWGRWLAAVLVAAVLFGVLHPIWTYANGAPFAGAMLLFGLIGVTKGLATSRRA